MYIRIHVSVLWLYICECHSIILGYLRTLGSMHALHAFFHSIVGTGVESVEGSFLAITNKQTLQASIYRLGI